ncbi:hypothetical protein MHBO_001989 [Bonamia ostreae]|uniref:Uncharacterized protein n=1 Tax=Bonamia ostreae TaxID=126728 RepID=A0ABV2AKT5_9EUKA
MRPHCRGNVSTTKIRFILIWNIQSNNKTPNKQESIGAKQTTQIPKTTEDGNNDLRSITKKEKAKTPITTETNTNAFCNFFILPSVKIEL